MKVKLDMRAFLALLIPHQFPVVTASATPIKEAPSQRCEKLCGFCGSR